MSVMTDPSGMPSLSGAWKEDLHLAALLVTDTQFKERAQLGVGGGRSMMDGAAHLLLSLDPLLELLVFSNLPAHATDLTSAW